MNIASIIDNQFYLSGVNAYWSSMARALRLMGHTIHTIGLDSGVHPWNTGLFDSLVGRSHRFHVNGSNEAHLEQGASLFLAVAPDVVFHHYSDFGIDLSLRLRSKSRKRGWKDVYVCHSDDPDHYDRIRRWKCELSHILCVSGVCQRHVVNSLGFDSEATSVNQYFFVPPANRIAGDPSQCRMSLKSLKSAKILYAGRLETYQKRAGDLVALSRALDDSQVDYVLHVAGSGSMEDDLRMRLKAAVKEGRVIFHGYLCENELFGLMEKSNIYVSFSEFEGISTSLIQAMHFGLVPIITPTASGSNFLTHESDALFFDVGDMNRLAELIRGVLTGVYDYGRIVENVAATVERSFSIDRSKSQLAQTLDRIEKRSR